MDGDAQGKAAGPTVEILQGRAEIAGAGDRARQKPPGKPLYEAHAAPLEDDEHHGAGGGERQTRRPGLQEPVMRRAGPQTQAQDDEAKAGKAKLGDELGGDIHHLRRKDDGRREALQDGRPRAEGEAADHGKGQELRAGVADHARPDKGAPLADGGLVGEHEPGRSQQQEGQEGVENEKAEPAPADRGDGGQDRAEAVPGHHRDGDRDPDQGREDDANLHAGWA